MFFAGNILYALATVLDKALEVYMWIIIIHALLSWVSPDPYNPIVRFLDKASDLLLRPLRRIIPLPAIGLDITPMIAIFIIYFVRLAFIQSLFQVAGRLG